MVQCCKAMSRLLSFITLMSIIQIFGFIVEVVSDNSVSFKFKIILLLSEGSVHVFNIKEYKATYVLYNTAIIYN